MPKLRTTQGDEVTFSADHIFLLTSDGGPPHRRGAAVYGLTGASIHTDEDPAALLNRLNLSGKFASLSRPEYGAIWVNAAAVSSLRLPRDPEFPAGVRTVVAIGSMTLGVTDSLEDVTAALNQRGAAL